MAAQKFGRGDPSVMVFDRFGASRFIGVAQLTFAITHDQQTLDPQIITAVLEFLQVRLVFGFVLEELIYIFNSINIKLKTSNIKSN